MSFTRFIEIVSLWFQNVALVRDSMYTNVDGVAWQSMMEDIV